jgi:hypothetical protein
MSVPDEKHVYCLCYTNILNAELNDMQMNTKKVVMKHVNSQNTLCLNYYTRTHAHTHTHSLTLLLTHSLLHSATHSHTQSLSLTHSLSLSRSRTHSLTHSHSHSHSHNLSLFLSPFLLLSPVSQHTETTCFT